MTPEPAMHIRLWPIAVLVIATSLLFRKASVEFFISAFLKLLYKIRAAEGGSLLDGPNYSWPNGQMVEKFLQARTKSWEWEKKYGKIYRIWAGTVPEVVITDPKDVQTFYLDSSDHGKSDKANAGWLLSLIMGSGAGLINGDSWVRLRKSLDPMFSHRRALSLLQGFIISSKDYVNNIDTYRLRSQPKSNGAAAELTMTNQVAGAEKKEKQDEKEDGAFIVNAVQALQRYPFFETARIFFGNMNAAETDRLWELSKLYGRAFQHVIAGGLNRTKLTKWARTKSYRETIEYQKQWDEYCEQLYETRIRDGRHHTPLVQLKQAASKGEITNREIYHTIAESLFANLDVTTHVLASAIILLADNAKVQASLRSEFQKECASENDLEAYVSRKDTLLHYCLLESLRLQPVLPFTFPEYAGQDKVLSGYVIPKNTTVIIDAYAINVRNPFWGSNSGEYQPSRFANIPVNSLRYNLSLFGYGPRKCLGQHITDKMLRTFIYFLFTKYRVSVLPNQIIDGAFKVDKSSWVGLFDVELSLEKR
ncbi:cytochrome P450 monooxygenase GliC2 [Xylona heveae TC161]|uniref:Cytochrome P450 monooxygenase GliC2 n=1 Tax=Xylona heveae (strain CBS 132557 / TC161) TaxID=1328760 RepID=A0A165IQ43_XYLHT|nr:cytochrome P450 monooxygenase GliC2 [Xylona heveae TC161]KZF25220.1 cytochrome P450 monooxygenase GliC2 [Xylona heveae TC161]